MVVSSTPHDSLELRWFGRLSDDADTCLGPDPAASLQSRTDTYVPSGPACGIKVREGQIDVKTIRHLPEPPPVPGVDRPLQGWRKWCLPVERLTGFPAASWIRVDKHRDLVFDEFRGLTIQREHSRLAVAGTDWWSVCLELSGRLELVTDAGIQDRLAQHLQAFRPHLQAGICASYPAWLCHHVRAEPLARIFHTFRSSHLNL